jgi:hypothetical protein
MDILVLSLVAGMVTLGGLWLATRETESSTTEETTGCD